MEVEYREIPGFEGYRAGTDGSIWSCLKTGPAKNRDFKEWKQLQPYKRSCGRLFLKLQGKHRAVHRLVLEAFCGKCPEGMETLHSNDDPTDNRLENLRWGTRSDNYKDRVLHGTDVKGEKHGRAKLTELAVTEIRSSHAQHNYTHQYLATKYGVDRKTIGDVINRKNWNHVA